MERRCVICNRVIPLGRIEAIPDTDTCVDHSDTKPYMEDDVDLSNANQGDWETE